MVLEWCMARFVMNSQVVTDGYPWVVVPFEHRQEYMVVLEQASMDNLFGLLGGLMGCLSTSQKPRRSAE